MSKQIRAGKRETVKGHIRESVGKLNGKKGQQIRGKLEQARGKAQTRLGKGIRKM